MSQHLHSLPRDSTMADTFYDRIQTFLKEAQAELADDEQLVVQVPLATSESLTVEDIGYHNPSLLRIYCRDQDGASCTVLVHMTSLQLVTRTCKPVKNQPTRQIGFLADRERRVEAQQEVPDGERP